MPPKPYVQTVAALAMAVTAFVVVAGLSSCSERTDSNLPPQPTPEEYEAFKSKSESSEAYKAPDLSEPDWTERQRGGRSREEMMATFINLHGKLCAKVDFVSTEIAPGRRQVNCTEYRDARKAGTKHNKAVYIVDLNQGTVELAGRS